MFVFSKVLDQLIGANFLKINSIRDLSNLDFKRNYLVDNLIRAVSVSLKTFCSTMMKCVKYCALELTLKALLGINL